MLTPVTPGIRRSTGTGLIASILTLVSILTPVTPGIRRVTGTGLAFDRVGNPAGLGGAEIAASKTCLITRRPLLFVRFLAFLKLPVAIVQSSQRLVASTSEAEFSLET